MGKPKVLKADRDGAFSSLALKRLLEKEDIELKLNTTKTGVADIERLHKTLNEKFCIIKNSDDSEANLSKIETILFIYNHKTKHDTTGQTPAHIFINAGQPILDTQDNKEIKINEINKDRTEYNVDSRYRKGPLQNRNRETHYYKTQFKKQKKINQLLILQVHGSS